MLKKQERGFESMVISRLDKHDTKLDVLLVGMTGLKVKVYSVCVAISTLVAYAIKQM